LRIQFTQLANGFIGVNQLENLAFLVFQITEETRFLMTSIYAMRLFAPVDPIHAEIAFPGHAIMR
jgi:hypothetical protein